MNTLITQSIQQSFSYPAYRAYIQQRLEEGKSTGEDLPESYTQYSKLNEQRMSRIDKTLKVLPEVATAIQAIDQPILWVVLTEGWCGDAAQNVPVLAALAELNPLIELHLVLRDQHLDLMDAFLTNGGRAIPKMVVLRKSDHEILGQWGPRPETAQQMVRDYKAKEVKEPYEEFQIKLQKWYAEDKTQTLQQEMKAMAEGWLAKMASPQNA